MSDSTIPVEENQDSERLEKDQENSVKYETYKKVLGEKKKRDEELRQARTIIETYEAEKKALEENSLKEKEDWRRLFEQRENDLKTTKAELGNIKAQILDSKKLNSFLKAVEKPIGQEFWGLVDLDRVIVDKETGEVDGESLKQYADDFKKTYWRIFDTSTGRMPNDHHNNKPNGITYEQWKGLPPSEQRKRLKDII